MPSKVVYWTSDGGGGSGSGPVAAELHQWILAQNDAELIIYGGDVYSSGTTQEFADFFDQMGGDVSRMCHTPGNHDWELPQPRPGVGEIPTGYEDFWSSRPSQQRIDTTKQGSARYEHFVDINGWRLIFLDTGHCKHRCEGFRKWPFCEQNQVAWLNRALDPPIRGRMLFAHHSRLSWGAHGDNPGLQDLWKLLFDGTGRPLVTLTLSGHDHNVSVYRPRSRELQLADDPRDGIQVIVNGAGGEGHYTRTKGTRAEIYPPSESARDDPPIYCITRIEIVDPTVAHLRILSFGSEPRSSAGPDAILFQQTYTVS